MASCFPVVEAHLESIETNGPAGEQHIISLAQFHPHHGISMELWGLQSSLENTYEAELVRLESRAFTCRWSGSLSTLDAITVHCKEDFALSFRTHLDIGATS